MLWVEGLEFDALGSLGGFCIDFGLLVWLGLECWGRKCAEFRSGSRWLYLVVHLCEKKEILQTDLLGFPFL